MGDNHQNLAAPSSVSRTLASLDFEPVFLSSSLYGQVKYRRVTMADSTIVIGLDFGTTYR
jgi:hypothetical protein